MAQQIAGYVDVSVDKPGKNEFVLGVDFGGRGQCLAASCDRLDRPVSNTDIGASEAVRADDRPAAHNQIKHAMSDVRFP